MTLFSTRSLRTRTAATCVLLVLGILLGGFIPALAQTPQFTNNSLSNSNNIFPWASTTTNKVQNPYLPNEIIGAYAGNITKVYWRHWTSSSMYGATTYTNLKIWIGQVAGNFQTNPSYSPGTYLTTGQLCINAGSYTIPAGTPGSWFGVQLTTPFYYNPANSLIIVSCHDGYSGTGHQLNAGNGTSPRRIWANGCTTASGSYDGLIYDIGIDMSSPYMNDAGISSLLSPVNFCAGTYPVQVNLKNFGMVNLNTVTINWTYDGAPQTPISWTTPLAPLAEAPVTLGTRTFASGVPHTLKVWTSNPNNATDSASLNDTLNATLKPALSGTFTIGGASPNYTTIAAAAADITTNGICGPVVFNIRTGSYNEQVVIGNVGGASATNTITFQSETGNRNDVTITYAATSTTNMATVTLAGADYVTFQNMTILGTGASYAQTIVISGGADYNRFINNIVRSINTTSTSNYYCCVYSNGSTDSYNEFRNNLFEYGAYCIYWFGSSTTALKVRTIFDNNIIQNWYYMGMYIYYQDAPQITGNTIQTNSTYTNYGMYAYYNYNGRVVSGNKFIFTGSSYKYAMMNYYCIGTSTAPGLVSNNFVTLSSTQSGYYPTYIYYNDYNNYYNNSYYNGTPTTSYYGAYIYYGTNNKLINDIFYHAGGGYAVYCAPGTNITASDYNLYYTSGATLAYWNGTATNLAGLQALTGRDQHSVSKPVNFANPTNGDLHLVGASQDDPALTGTMLPEVTVDIDNEPRARPYIGADEGCYITPGTVTFDITDVNGNPISYFNYPGTIYVKYNIAFPATAFTATITINFYTVPANTLAYTTSFTVSKSAGVPATGIQPVSIPAIASGYYRIEGVFNTKNSCDLFTTYKPGDKAALGLGQGQTPCVVWPGDANNNGVVDYGDRSALNKYIQLANLSPVWLQGPARYRADFATNPFTYYTWEGQAAAPWATPEGCYMDTDGNGVINSFDYIAMRVNWLRTHGPVPKYGETLQPGTFDMVQNYPNPFNPSTTISYSVPELSHVRLVVTDMLGREVATLVNGALESGVHTVTFDASSLNSGQYIATVTMIGESGMNFSKTIKMTLAK